MHRRLLVFVTVVAVALTALPAGLALAAPKKPHPVRVAADADPWVASGIFVEAGDELTVTARGTAITAPLAQFPGAKSGPDGQATLCPDPGGPAPGCALDGAPYGALIGKIGPTGVPFLVGSSYSATASDVGEVLFAVNDNLTFHFDNSGGFTVFVNR